ncbi:MAG TPA: integrase, partial [Sphingomicrobium sp.]
MSLEPYKRGATWWAKGKVEYNGRAITGYIRESTGASTEAGARDWIAERTRAEERRELLGHEEANARDFTFLDAVLLYKGGPTMAKYLIPVAERLGSLPVAKITPKLVKDIAAELYPDNATDTWKRWVITPTRAVINNANELGHCPPIRIPGFDKAARAKQDRARGKQSRKPKTPGSWEWLLQFREHAARYHRALALFMFTTGARVGQATAMHPDALDLELGTAKIPGAKGHDDRIVRLLP